MMQSLIINQLQNCQYKDNKMNQTIALPVHIYKFLVAYKLIKNNGTVIDKTAVQLSKQILPLFQNGVIVSKIVILILNERKQEIPYVLTNLRNDNSKNSRDNNWKFIWFSFDAIRIQFDTRIKELIIQGEYTLIVQIIKQLYEQVEDKKVQTYDDIIIKQKNSQIQTKTTQGIDFKKFDSKKNPSLSSTSLQLLILASITSFNFQLSDVLSLLANNNKYFALLLTKGINDSFEKIMYFYGLMNKYSWKLQEFFDAEDQDINLCLSAVRYGLFSKNQQVCRETVKLYSGLVNIYQWFISEDSGANLSLFMGVKRHHDLIDQYWQLLTGVIYGNQIEYFTYHFKTAFITSSQMLQATINLLPFISQHQMIAELKRCDIFTDWLQIAVANFTNNLQDKTVSLKFVGQIMHYFPFLIENDQTFLIIFKSDWTDYNIITFSTLFNEIIQILQKLAKVKNHLAKKIYQILLDIFEKTAKEDEKRQYMVENLLTVIRNFPEIPSEYLFESYRGVIINSADLKFIEEVILINHNTQGLKFIGQVLFSILSNNVINNNFTCPLLLRIVKQIKHTQIGQIFITWLLKQILRIFQQMQVNRKQQKRSIPQPLYLNKLVGHLKPSQQQTINYLVHEKEIEILGELIKKIVGEGLTVEKQELKQQLKVALLDADSYIRAKKHKIHCPTILKLLQNDFKLGQSQINAYNEEYKNKHSRLLQSSVFSVGRARVKSQLLVNKPGPQHLVNKFRQIVQKRRQSQNSRLQSVEKKNKEDTLKMILARKEVEKNNLMKGFAGQAQLKQEGGWEKIVKESKNVQLHDPDLIEDRDLQAIQVLFKKYHKMFKHLFDKFSGTMIQNVKSVRNFQQQHQRAEIMSFSELMKFLKTYKCTLPTKQEVSIIVRDINIKLLKRRSTIQELDFAGFQQFLIQYALVFETRPNVLTVKNSSGSYQIHNRIQHLSPYEIVQIFVDYLKRIAKQFKQDTQIYDEPQVAYFNETQMIRQLNKRLQENSNYILPEGYKKVVQKQIQFLPVLNQKKIKGVNSSFVDIFQLLDQIFYQSPLQMHIIQPISVRHKKARAIPTYYIKKNISSKGQLDSTKNKSNDLLSLNRRDKRQFRAESTQRKKIVSMSLKLFTGQFPLQDRPIANEVAEVVQQILQNIQKTQLQKNIKRINESVRRRQQQKQKQKSLQLQRQKKFSDRKVQFEKLKANLKEQKQKMELVKSEELEKKKIKQIERQKRRKQLEKKYLSQQQQILKKRKQQKEQQLKKKQQEQRLKRQQEKKLKEKFKQFNKKQMQSIKKIASEAKSKINTQQQHKKQSEKHNQVLHAKLKNKIAQQDDRIMKIRNQKAEQIKSLFHSEPIRQTFKKYRKNVQAIFDFLVKNTFLSLTDKKHNNSIIYDTWHLFNSLFQLTPYIISSNEYISIFKILTREKQVSKQYYVGLNFQEFQEALLRISIKHKKFFNKISQKIKQDSNSNPQFNKEDIKDNQFQGVQTAEDYNKILVEEDIDKSIIDDYGDISKVNEMTLKGLIFYLKVPADLHGQQKRFRQILQNKNKKKDLNISAVIKMKLSTQYSLASPKKIKKKSIDMTSNKKIQQKQQNQVPQNQAEVKQQQQQQS